MSLREKIMEDLKAAMRGGDEVARDTLRMLKSELMNREIELGKELDESEEIAVLQKAVKSRQDSAQQYDQGGRKDLADRERAEIGIIEKYLPKQMSEDEVRDAVRTVAAEIGATSKKDQGKLMKELMARYKGVIDGKLAAKIAGEVLA